MGVDARLVFYARDRATAEAAGKAAFDRIAELDGIMSDYRKDSELMRLCGRAGGRPVPVSRDLYRVFERSIEISRRTGGAFDITCGPLVALWRTARKTGKLPDPEAIEEALSRVGWQKIHLELYGRMVSLDTPGMRLDLGGIGKGYADDEAQRVLKRYGVESALVEMGGDIVVSNPPPGAKGWTIRVPNAGDDHGPKDLVFANCAISSSGDTEQFVVIGGAQYSHVVDPRTGWALTNRVQGTIVARDGFTSDPLSKTLSLMDDQALARLMRLYPGVTLYRRTLAAGS